MISPVWEAVVLLTTQKEVEKGEVQNFVNSIPQKSYPIPFVMFLNHFNSANQEALTQIESQLKELFLSVEIVYHSIVGLDDM